MTNNPDNKHFYSDPRNIPPTLKYLRLYYKNVGKIFPGVSAKLFWYLFSKPRKRTIRDRHREFLATASKSTIVIDKDRLSVYTWGDGEKSIFIAHGWEGMAADFYNIINALISKDYRVVAIDYQGHGTSEGKHVHMPLVVRTMKKVYSEYGPFYGVIGHSFGAATSCYTLAEIEDRFKVSKLILLGLHPEAIDFFYQFKDVLGISDKLFDKCVAYTEKKVGRSIKDFNIGLINNKVKADKILVIHDKNDFVASLPKVRKLVETWDNATLLVDDHGGHYKHFKHPDAVKKIMEFL